MKDYFNRRKSKLLLFTLLAFMVGASPAVADELTVNDGTGTSSYVPIYGNYVDTQNTTSEFIIPADRLEDLEGGTISQMTFYLSTPKTDAWENVVFEVYLKEVTATTYASATANTEGTNTVVYSGSLDGSKSTMVVPFSSNYVYGGGNLLVGFKVTTEGYYAETYFSGEKFSYGTYPAYYYGTSSYNGRDNFLPKVTFEYTAGVGVMKKPKDVTASNISMNSATISWTAGGSETSWEVSYSTSADEPAAEGSYTTVNTNSYELTGLTAGTTYYVYVRSVDGDNKSKWSKVYSFTPGVLTINNTSTTTNNYVPIYGNYMDAKSVCQFVLPKESLTALNGSQITKIVFYGSINVVSKLESHTFEIYMGEVAEASIAALADWTTLENVYTGSLTIADGKMTITLADGFDYNGENLLIGLKQTDSGSDYSQTTWTGVASTGASLGGYGTSVSQRNFLPQMSFYYSAQTTTVKKPKNLAASDVATTTATLGWTDGEEGLTAWQIAYATDTDFDPETEGTKVAADANPFKLTELTAATTYYAYVRAKKGEDYSKWSNKVEFTTLAATPIMELSATALSFGLVSDADAQAQTFTIGNTGGVALSNLSITCDNAAFTITDGEGNALGTTIAAGETLTVKVKMNAVGQQNGKITISGDGVEAQTVTVSGYKADDTKIVETFASLPDRWTATGSWTYNATTGAYGTTYGGATLISPKITVAEGETLAISAKTAYAGASYYVTIEGSADNGSTWTAFDAKTYSTASEPALITTDFTVINITDIPTTVNRLRITAYYANINLFNGFTYAPDPVLALYSDEDCTTTVASEVSKSFGFVTEEQSQSYYIKNTGTGQIDLSASVVDGFAVNITDEALTAGESTAVTITMPATEGTHNAAIVVTATNHDTGEVLGTFTVNASGALRNAAKYYADGFTALPSGWTVDGTWYYSAANGANTNAWYLSSNARLKTPMLTLAAGETIAVEAKGLSTSNTSYQHLQLQYSTDGTTWTNLGDELTLDPSNWQTFMVTGPAEAGKYYIGILASQACVRMFYGGEEVSGANFAINTDGSTQDFGTVKANATAEKTFTVTNNGNATLNVSFAVTGDFTVTDPAPSRKFRLTDNLGWGTGYVYAWDSEGNALLGEWPGTVCEKTYNDMGDTQFVVAVPNGAVGVVVNNGNGAQTVDITNFTQGYWMDGSKDGSGHYKVEGWTGDGATEEIPAVLTVAAGESETFTVAMNTATPGSKSGNVTLSFEALNATNFTIPCTGFVKDPNALEVDFADGNFPENWQVGANWSVTSGYAVQSQTSLANASAIVTTPLTVAEDETLTFKVARNLTGSSSYKKSLKVRYSQDGGVNWSEYKDYGDEFGSSFATYELTGVPAGTVILEFYGCNIKLDDIEGFTKTTGPVLALTENGTAVAKGDTKDFGNITADATATYTLKNAGNAALAATLAGEGVTVSPASVNLAAGETAEITVTMAYAEPYGVKTGKMTIKSESWVGDMTVNFTADAIDQSGFVVDFSDNARPAGWYNGGWTIANGVAYVYAGTNKQLISEKIGAEEGKNVLRFDAKAYTGSESQTLSVYTSADRKNWSEAQTFTLTGESQTFSLETLDNGEYYVKFEALNAQVDNIKGVKKLDAPAHDLYLVSSSLPTAEITPLDTYTAKVSVASLRADETVSAELYFGENKMAEQTGVSVSNGATQEFTLTSKADAGTYDVYVKVSTADLSLETEKVSVTVADKSAMTISDFAVAATSVQADDNNAYEAAFNVTVQNTGSTSLTSDQVAVTLTDNDDSENVISAAWSDTDMLYMRTSNGSADIAADCTLKAWCWNTTEDGEWIEFVKVSDGLYSLSLNGKANFIVTRVNPAGTDEDPWKNVWNKTGDMAISNGHFISFTGYSDATMNFTSAATGMLNAGESVTLKVALSGTLTDGENKSFTFKAKENVSDTEYVLSRSVSVNAAPVITLNESTAATIATGENRKVELTHKFVEGWNTICVPFAISDLSTFGEGAVAFSFDGYNAVTKELTFNKVNALEAAKPYVIYTPAAINSAMTFTGVTIAKEAAEKAGASEYSPVIFQGSYAPMASGSLDGCYGLTAKGRIAKAKATATMQGFRAYFTGVPAQARVAFIGFDETQGISTVSVGNAAADGVFDMQGRKVETLRKGGLYIVGGKKQVVK